MGLDQVAALVVSYNTRDMLRGCLSSLTAGIGGRLEVIVVDNASVDGSADMVAAEFPKLGLLRAGTNLGFGRAANLGATQTRRQHLLTLNPDCHAAPEAVRTLAAALDRDPGLGFAGPKILLESGQVDHACLRADPDPWGAALYFSRVPRLFPNSARLNRYSLRHLDYDQEQELRAGTCGCLMFRAEAFRRVRGFDEEFFMYGEDLDLCRRIREAGYAGRYAPSAQVLHVKGEATRQDSGRMLVEFHRSMWIYYRKHEAPRRPGLLNGLVAAGIWTLGAFRVLVNNLRRDKRVSSR